MNAYLIAAKANAFELDQHVGRALDANQPDYIVEAIGCGEGHAELESVHGERFRDSIKHLFGMN